MNPRSASMRLPLLVLAVGLVAWLWGCGQGAPSPATPGSSATSSSPARVTMLQYSEYIDPELPVLFRERTGIEVKIDVYEDTESMLAKLQHGGSRLYDVVVASDHAIPMMAKLGMIGPMDLDRLPHAKAVSARFQKPEYDPEGKLSMPYQWGTMGLLLRKDRFPELPRSWSVLFEPGADPQPFLLLDSMRDMLGLASKYLGNSVNSVDLEQVKAAGEVTLKAKASSGLVGFDGSVGAKNKLLSGMASLGIVYSGEAFRAMEEDPRLTYVIPEEGAILWVDAMVIPREAPQREAAHRLVDFLLEPEVNARLSRFTGFCTPVEESLPLLGDEFRNSPAISPPEAVLQKCELLRDVGASTRLYDEVWTAVKSR